MDVWGKRFSHFVKQVGFKLYPNNGGLPFRCRGGVTHLTCDQQVVGSNPTQGKAA